MTRRAPLALALTLASAAGCAPAPATDACGDAIVCEPGERCFPAGCDAATRCARGPEAELYGRDRAADGGCAPSGDDACRRSTVSCPVWGQCAAPPAGWSPRGVCPTASRRDGDFVASRDPACAGRASCIALHNNDCESARVCGLEGRCVAQDGICVAADDAACKRSELCHELGHCTRVGGACRAVTAQDCLASAACLDRGDCGVVTGGCGACRRSEGCALEGWCDLLGDACRATRPEHCASSRACKTDGRCRPVGGHCVR